ncbi:MAG: glycine--tRNA ligase [Pontiellaceae bacterium]
MNTKNYKVDMETIVSLSKRRGFIFQTSEIYGGINGFWDYGPLGVEMKRNIKSHWWKSMTQYREDIVGLDSSIIMHPKVWESSGHIGNFKDPMVDCRETKNRYRADQLCVLKNNKNDNQLMFCYHEGSIKNAEKKIQKNSKLDINDYSSASLLDISIDLYSLIIAPDTNEAGTLTEPRSFNLMFKTFVGPLEENSNVAYLRPETAQGIFSQFGNVLSTIRNKIPFGIAQIGKAFRNEINPRNYTFRSREFEQMEVEYFIKPGSDNEMHQYWVNERLNWYTEIGLSEERLHKDVHANDALAHYASACTDIMYEFPFGLQELEGIAARGNFDLTQHQNESGKKLEYIDEENKTKYIPHVIEPSAGVDRIALALLCEAYTEEWIPKDGGDTIIAEPNAKRPPEGYEKRIVLKFSSCIAPYKVAVLPLVKNKEVLVNKSREIYNSLSRKWKCFYDQNGAIGRRYRRQDEIGTPLCITIDFETIEQDDCVTIRDRDNMKQKRVPICELESTISTLIDC